VSPTLLAVLTTVAEAFGLALEAVVDAVRAKHPELDAQPLPGLEAVDAAREEAQRRLKQP
jgi:hypothetical protein